MGNPIIIVNLISAEETDRFGWKFPTHLQFFTNSPCNNNNNNDNNNNSVIVACIVFLMHKLLNLINSCYKFKKNYLLLYLYIEFKEKKKDRDEHQIFYRNVLNNLF